MTSTCYEEGTVSELWRIVLIYFLFLFSYHRDSRAIFCLVGAGALTTVGGLACSQSKIYHSNQYKVSNTNYLAPVFCNRLK